MKYYGVTTKFFDDGKVRAFCFEVEADEKPENEFESLKECDIYKNYFESLEEAEAYRDDAYRA
jgi:hypothetical protein